MTSPQPPRLRDTRSLADRVRQDRSNLKQLGVGFVGGRYRPARPLGSPALFGDAENDQGRDRIFGENEDVTTAAGPGTVTFQLSHEPLPGTLHIRWNGVDQPPTEWVLSGSTVTIPDPYSWFKAGHKFTAAYLYDGNVVDAPDASPYNEAVLAEPTLLGFWRLAEAGGTMMVDSSGNGHHGTYTAGVVLGESPILSDDPDTTALFPLDESPRGVVPYGSWMNVPTFTIECWVDATGIAGGGIRALPNRDTNARSWVFRIDSGGNLRFEKLAGGSASSVGTATLEDSDRHYVVATYDGANIKLYVDSVLIQTTATTGDPSTLADFAVGATYAGDSTWWVPYYYAGHMSKVAFYSGAQSAASILNRWNIGTGA